MREFVLNHASVYAPDATDPTSWLVGIAGGMAALIDGRVASSTLRMYRHMGHILCRPGHSLFDACIGLRSHDRDSHLLLMRLAQKVPVSQGLEPDAKDRLLACEGLSPSGDEGEPLLVCAISDGITVGFPSLPEWDRDQLHITFEELLPNGELDVAEEAVDNLTRAVHAQAILRRHRDRQRAGATADEVWERRPEAFPNLLFGPQVERHIKEHRGLLPQILVKLAALDDSVRDWDAGGAPPWAIRVTAESETVMNTPKLRKARQFESAQGGKGLFPWHARIGNGYRIHLRFDATDRSLEIGYIGPHLPTK